jgi:hypothetical protein
MTAAWVDRAATEGRGRRAAETAQSSLANPPRSPDAVQTARGRCELPEIYKRDPPAGGSGSTGRPLLRSGAGFLRFPQFFRPPAFR